MKNHDDSGDKSEDENDACQKSSRWHKTSFFLSAGMLSLLLAILCCSMFAKASSALPIMVQDNLLQKFFAITKADKQTESKKTEACPRKISCLGRLEPSGEVLRILPPAFIKDERVAVVSVSAGQKVKEGDVIAVMDSHARLDASLVEANQRVIVCRAQLNKILAGAKQGEIDAQRSAVERLSSELECRGKEMDAISERLKSEARLASSEFERYSRLQEQGAVSLSELDKHRTTLETAKARLAESLAERSRFEETTKATIREAQSTLVKVKEVRPVDVELAGAELSSALAAADKIKTDLSLSIVRAPKAGRILRVWAHPGEAVQDKGIAELGQTDQMIVVAEVYDADLRFIRKNSRAQVRASALGQVLNGSVSEIGWKVNKQSVYSNEPGANFDNRVVEVRVFLDHDSSKLVEGLTNLQVEVLFSG